MRDKRNANENKVVGLISAVSTDSTEDVWLPPTASFEILRKFSKTFRPIIRLYEHGFGRVESIESSQEHTKINKIILLFLNADMLGCIKALVRISNYNLTNLVCRCMFYCLYMIILSRYCSSVTLMQRVCAGAFHSAVQHEIPQKSPATRIIVVGKA